MKRFNTCINGGTYINVQATRMETYMKKKIFSDEECKEIGLAVIEIKRRRRNLSPKQIATLCGQAKAGNPEAALRGLRKILDKKIGGDSNG